MHGNTARVADNLVISVYESGPEVDKYVNDKHHIDDVIHYDQGVGVYIHRSGIPSCFRVLVAFLLQFVPGQDEGGHIRSHYRRVDNQEQHQPVPECLEGRVVEYCPRVDFRRLELVLWKHVSTERHNLETQHRSLRLGATFPRYVLFLPFRVERQFLSRTALVIEPTFHWDSLLAQSNNTPLLPQKNLHRHCFRLLLRHLHVPWEIANNDYSKFWGVKEVHYGICASREWRRKIGCGILTPIGG